MTAARRRLAAYTADTVPTHPDAQLLRTWLATRPDLDPIPLSIGDPGFTGSAPPAGLRDLLAEAPQHTHGYQYTGWGLPEARQLIAQHLVDEQHLAEHATPSDDFDIALTSHGTRAVMRDFGRWLLTQHPGERRAPVALCATPGWDYAGPLESAGYQMRHWPLRVEHGWWPHLDDIDTALHALDHDPDARLGLVVINAQHNPTGRSWPSGTVRHLIHAAHQRGAGILLDDPYYAVHTGQPDAVPCPALRELLAILHANPPAPSRTGPARRHWCAVRSLGKQFAVNGWGVGTVTAHPDTLNALDQSAFAWAFPGGADRQWAMARWLTDDASARWTAGQRATLRGARTALTTALRDLGWPADTVPAGECTPYALIPVPRAYHRQPGGAARWRTDLLAATGVLLAPATIEHPDLDAPYLRIYLGAAPDVLDEALTRIRRAGVTYHGPALPAGPAAPQAPSVDDAAHGLQAQARTRQDAATLLRRLAATAHHPTDQAIVEQIADWFAPAWYLGDHRPPGTGAAAAAILKAARTDRADHIPAFAYDEILTHPPVRVPDRASVLLHRIAGHTHPDTAAELVAVADTLAEHTDVDTALSKHLHTHAMRDLAAPPPAPALSGPAHTRWAS
ncbi:MAG: pyridoxal phosphate-dependent aminotransferase [Actinocatenispora sp.]